MPEEDIEIKVSSFYSKIKEPVLVNPQLRVTSDIRTSKFYPAPLPDIFRGDQLVVVGRYAGTGNAAVIIEGMVNNRSTTFAYDVKFPDQASDNEFIPRLWAARRIGYLLDESRLHGENKELRDEITELARKYGIVTPYTAYLIVEDEGRRNVPVTARSLQDLERDKVVREQATHAWSTFNETKSGAGAVSGAMASDAFRLVKNVDELASASGMKSSSGGIVITGGSGSGRTGSSDFGDGKAARRAFINATPVPASSEVAQRFDQYAQQTRFVNGRAFFQNGIQWIDANVQKLPNARRVQVKFNSDDYFALLAKYPDAAQWLSIGRNIQVALGDVIYEVAD